MIQKTLFKFYLKKENQEIIIDNVIEQYKHEDQYVFVRYIDINNLETEKIFHEIELTKICLKIIMGNLYVDEKTEEIIEFVEEQIDVPTKRFVYEIKNTKNHRRSRW